MPQVTAASYPIKIGDKTYEMRPLTDRDVDEINNWLRSTFIQMARNSFTPDMKAAEREETLSVAMSRARKLSFMSGEGAEVIGSIDGVSRVLWQGCRSKHPTLTFEEFYAEIFRLKDKSAQDLANDIEASMLIWQEINVGKQAPAKTADASGEPTGAAGEGKKE